MGVVTSKFWRLCKWLEGQEVCGLVPEMQAWEGTYKRTSSKGLENILGATLKGLVDERKRFKELWAQGAFLKIEYKEAKGDLFHGKWRMTYSCGKRKEKWDIRVPLRDIDLGRGRCFTTNKTSVDPVYVVARSVDYKQIMVWQEGTPVGSLRRVFTIEGDKVVLRTNAYGPKGGSAEEIYERIREV